MAAFNPTPIPLSIIALALVCAGSPFVSAQNASVPLAHGDKGHIAVDVQVNDGNTLALGGAGVSVKHEKNSAGVFLGEQGDLTVKAERKEETLGLAGRLTTGQTSRTLGLELKMPFGLFSGNGRDRPLAEPPPFAEPVEPPAPVASPLPPDP